MFISRESYRQCNQPERTVLQSKQGPILCICFYLIVCLHLYARNSKHLLTISKTVSYSQVNYDLKKNSLCIKRKPNGVESSNFVKPKSIPNHYMGSFIRKIRILLKFFLSCISIMNFPLQMCRDTRYPFQMVLKDQSRDQSLKGSC